MIFNKRKIRVYWNYFEDKLNLSISFEIFTIKYQYIKKKSLVI